MEERLDIKGINDKLESGDGCALRAVIGSMRFEDQKEVWAQLKHEAESRPDNVLSFKERSVSIDLPNGTPTGDSIPVIDIYRQESDGKLHNIFEAYNEIGSPNVIDVCSDRSNKN